MNTDARDAVRAALAEEDPITAMRAVAIDLAGRGLSKAAVEGAFSSICNELADAGRDDQAGLVAEVLDMMDEWYAGGKAVD